MTKYTGKNIFNYLIVALFFSAIFIPLILGLVTKDRKLSSFEKRKLASLPSLPNSKQDFSQFPKKFSRYYRDHFGLRDPIVYLYNLIKFKLGDASSDKVIIGKNGLLFLNDKPFNNPLVDYRNIHTYSSKDLKLFVKFLTAKYLWLKKKGIKYIFVIAPNKHTIYPEFIPDHLGKVRKRSALDQIMDFTKKYTEVPVIDLRKPLIENKNTDYLLYYQTDTHWNSYGANIAQHEIAKKISLYFPGQITPVLYNYNDFTIKKKRGGDLANLIGLRKLLFEYRPVAKFQPCAKRVKTNHKKSRATFFTTQCDGSKLNALVFRDSFFSVVQPFFSEYFKRITYVWKQITFNPLKKYTERERPDIVIEEWCERFLPAIGNLDIRFLSAMYRAVYQHEDHEKIIFKLDEKTIGNIVINKDIKKMPENDSHVKIHIHATGSDPIILLPEIDFESGQSYIIKIKINTAQKTMLQIFFSEKDTVGYPFNLKNVIGYPLIKGDNELYLPLTHKNLGKKLRMDPGIHQGTYMIKDIEIKKINDIDMFINGSFKRAKILKEFKNG